MTPPEARTRLGATVRAARARAGLTLDDAAELARMSPTTWAKVEKGEDGVRRLTYASIERTLGWGEGSIAQVLAGGDPVPSTDRPAHAATTSRRRFDYIAAWEEEILTEIWSRSDLNDEQREDLSAKVRARAADLRVVEDRLRRTA